MKKLTYSLLIGLLAGAAGCVVSSVYPFYLEKDLVFEPALVGVWVSHGKESSTSKFEFTQVGPKEYNIGLDPLYSVHLFRLESQLFLDLFPAMDTKEDADHVPVHRLYRVDQIEPTLKLTELNYEWVADCLTRDPQTIAHLRIEQKNKEGKINPRYVFAAPTKELQAFVLKHLKTKDAWGETTELSRQ